MRGLLGAKYWALLLDAICCHVRPARVLHHKDGIGQHFWALFSLASRWGFATFSPGQRWDFQSRHRDKEMILRCPRLFAAQELVDMIAKQILADDQEQKAHELATSWRGAADSRFYE